MPRSLERKAARRGGVAKYRTIKRNGETLRCMITRKAGPRGGKTLCYKTRGKS